MNPMQQGTRTMVGYTNLGPVLDEMKNTDATASIFNDDVRNYVTDASFKKAWETWYANWKEFYAARFNGRTNFDILHTDDVAAKAREYRQDLARFQATYANMKTADGKPLASNAPQLQITPPPRPEDKKDGIPLWTFLAVAGVLGVGVFIYWRLKKTGQMLAARERVLKEDVLPLALSSHFGPELGTSLSKAATAGDATRATCECARDLEMKVVPRAASKYILSGS